MLALLVLSLLQTPEQRFDPETTKLLVFDASRGMTLRIQTDGKVELTVKEEDKETGTKGSRTLSEASAEEFRAKHPELVKKYELDRYLGGKTKGVSQDEFDEWWKQLRKGMPGLGPVPGLDQPFDEDVQKFLEEQRELFGRLRRSRNPRPPTRLRIRLRSRAAASWASGSIRSARRCATSSPSRRTRACSCRRSGPDPLRRSPASRSTTSS